MTSYPVGRVSKSDPESALAPIGNALQAINEEQAGLVEAVREARAAGCSWTQIGRILDVTRQAAQQRFGPLVDEPAGEDELPHQPVDLTPIDLAPIPAAPQLQDAPRPARPRFDFTALATMTDDQLVAAAARLPRDEKLFDPYLRAQREAIVIMLYRRGWLQSSLAPVIGRSRQRVSQIVVGFYDRQRREWEEERVRG